MGYGGSHVAIFLCRVWVEADLIITHPITDNPYNAA